MKKFAFTLIFVLGVITTSIAQNKVESKAQEKVDELNTELVSIDPSLALTEDQKEKIFKLHVDRIKETRKIYKEEKDKEKAKELAKPVNKKYFQTIYKDVLTKEQRQARVKAKKDK